MLCKPEVVSSLSLGTSKDISLSEHEVPKQSDLNRNTFYDNTIK